MRKGTVLIKGNAGKNTGALLNGGTVIIEGILMTSLPLI